MKLIFFPPFFFFSPPFFQTLYEKIHAVHQNFNKFQNRCTDGNINAPKWIRHLGDAYNIIRKTRKLELPEDWTIARLQEELAKSRDFVTDLSPDHPTLRHELLTDDERRQVEEAFAVHVEGAYYEVGSAGEEGVSERAPTLQEVCETVVAWLRTVPTTFVSVDKYRRYPLRPYRGRHHNAEFAPVSADTSASSGSRSNGYSRSYSSYNNSKTSPTKPKYSGSSSYRDNGKSNYRHYNSNFPPHPSSSTPHQIESQTTPAIDGVASDATPIDPQRTEEKADTVKISRQVDCSYRLSGDFDTVCTSTSNSEAATDSNNESNDDDSANDSNESAPESSNPDSPNESSTESSNDTEFAWNSIVQVPRESLAASSEALEIRLPQLEPARVPEPEVNQGTSEVAPPSLTSFNETSFGMFKRSSLPPPEEPTPSRPLPAIPSTLTPSPHPSIPSTPSTTSTPSPSVSPISTMPLPTPNFTDENTTSHDAPAPFSFDATQA